MIKLKVYAETFNFSLYILKERIKQLVSYFIKKFLRSVADDLKGADVIYIQDDSSKVTIGTDPYTGSKVVTIILIAAGRKERNNCADRNNKCTGVYEGLAGSN